MTPFSTILIANRGEIAVRIARTAKAMGFRTVAVYSEIDADMPHVRAADSAVCIGSAPAAQSYLNGKKVIDAARKTGAEAIHPGYGFLSESPDFAEACEAAGLIFVGPSANAIRAMGNKATAKEIMTAIGVPCLPGYDGQMQDEETLATEADRIGYPVMLKATGGGGGKGMRLIESRHHLAEGLAMARSEALKSFGDGHLMVEKAIVAPRHIEVQIFADSHGGVVVIGDRDCSIQRRHQKVIEEAPAPNLDPEVRNAMAAAAKAAAHAIKYRGAGTVEFLLEADGSFYFLEMNTRLQVEHPVTEMIAGLDLVEWQFLIAAGEPLPLRQNDISLRGHAIEARLCAEDPRAGFLPQTGRIISWRPAANPGTRIDHALTSGVCISAYYDSMIAKIVGYGRDREQARRIVLGSIEDTFVAGLETNKEFLRECLSCEDFISAKLGTDFIERHLTDWELATRDPSDLLVGLAAALFYQRSAVDHERSLVGWHSSPGEREDLVLQSGDWSEVVEVTPLGDGNFVVQSNGGSRSIDLLEIGDDIRATIDGIEQKIAVAWDEAKLTVGWRGMSRAFEQGRVSLVRDVPSEANLTVRAPMPGMIAQVNVSISDPVNKGDVLLILEAMKMEHLVRAPSSGTLIAINVTEGQQVSSRESLVVIEPERRASRLA